MNILNLFRMFDDSLHCITYGEVRHAFMFSHDDFLDKAIGRFMLVEQELVKTELKMDDLKRGVIECENDGEYHFIKTSYHNKLLILEAELKSIELMVKQNRALKTIRGE